MFRSHKPYETMGEGDAEAPADMPPASAMAVDNQPGPCDCPTESCQPENQCYGYTFKDVMGVIAFFFACCLGIIVFGGILSQWTIEAADGRSNFTK
ncbi:MAG: hypothetical protein Q8P67_09740 [archaeon]|nr:hypothetical protein [archaeon]